MLELNDIMRREVVTVAPELTLRELVGVLTEHDVTGAPVVANSQVVGVVSVTDVIEFEGDVPGVPVDRGPTVDDTEWAVAARWEDERGSPIAVFFTDLWEPTEVDTLERMSTPDSPEWNVLEEYTVSDVMTRAVVSLPPDASVQEAARYMLEMNVHRVLVMTDSQLQGIVTTTDIVRAVAEGTLG